MPVPRKRFEFLDDEVNLAITDFYSITSNMPINLPYIDIDWGLDLLKDLIERSIIEIIPPLPDVFGDMLLDLFNIDFGNLPNDFFDAVLGTINYEDVLGDMLTGVFGSLPIDPSLLNILKDFIPPFPMPGRVTIPGFNGQDIGFFVNSANRIIGDAFAGGRVDPRAVNYMIDSVINKAYEKQLYGAFTLLSKELTDLDILTTAAVPLLMRGARNADPMIILDIAASEVGSRIKTVNPYVVRDILRNYKHPAKLERIAMREFGLVYTEALKALDPGWMTYIVDPNISPDFRDVMRAITPDDINIPDEMFDVLAVEILYV